MKTPVIVGIVIVVIVVASGGIVLATHKSSTSSMPTMDMPTTSSTSSTSKSTSSTPVAANSVTIQNFAFSAASITVKKGTTVTWTNKDSATHTVAETDGQTGPSSSDLPTGKSYSFTYNTVGTFKYDCGIHPNMIGSVTVTE